MTTTPAADPAAVEPATIDLPAADADADENVPETEDAAVSRSRARRVLGGAKRRTVSVYKRFRYSVRRGIKRPISEPIRTYVKYTKSRRVDSRLVCYESHVGAGMICNPLAIFEQLLQDPRHRRLRHVWIINTQEEVDRLAQTYRAHSNVKFVLRGSDEFLKTLATAKYIIQNTSFPPYFAKRPEQICVNTWHSTTVKTLGFDMPDGNIQSRNVIRSLLMSDYIVSPNPFMTRIFRDSYRLQNLYTGKVLEVGYPRNDLTINTTRAEAIRDLKSRGVHVDESKEIILYAPTWRGDSAGEVQVDAGELARIREELTSRIDTDRYQLLIKAHHLIDRKLTDEERREGNYVPRQVDTNRLLAAVDIMVSDYSSIYIDFLTTQKPILFYIPDRDQYTADRGVYFDLHELPGPVTDDVTEVARWVNEIDRVAAEFRDRYEETKAWACARDDGSASARVVRAVFDGYEDDGVIADFLPSEKKRILFYVSAFAANGVSSAFKALLNRIDRDKYDVTVWGFLQDGASTDNFRALEGVRAMPRFGAFDLTRWEAVGLEYISRYGLDGPLTRVLKPEIPLARDFRRNFGDSEFDYMIDFSGYGILFPSVMRFAPSGRRIIWQHSDVTSDIQNTEKRKLKRNSSANTTPTGMKDTYAAFDRIVSCGEYVMEVNREALGTPETFPKFTYANNMIDSDRVRRLAAEIPDAGGAAISGYLPVSSSDVGGMRAFQMLPDSPPRPETGAPYLKFVTIGRLSPEKNHAALIEGFAKFTETHPNSRLYILGGGELQASLTRLAQRLGVEDRVSLTGHLDNPFAVVKQCDCFVLPSRYEGFGLVVPEVRMLQMPILLADFPAARSISVPNGQYLMGFEAEDIRDAMIAFAEGRVPTDYEFDVDAYNDQAYKQFVDMLESID